MILEGTEESSSWSLHAEVAAADLATHMALFLCNPRSRLRSQRVAAFSQYFVSLLDLSGLKTTVTRWNIRAHVKVLTN